MLKKTITYIDFDGNKRTEDQYFNMTRSELVAFSFDLPDVRENNAAEISNDNIAELGKKMIEKMGVEGIFNFVKNLVFKAYGVKSDDGRRFIKSEQLSVEFTQTMAYDELLMDLFSSDEKATEFINAVIPAEMTQQMPALKSTN